MAWSVDFAPLLPLWLVLGLGLLGGLFAAFALARRVAHAWLRALSLAAVAIALANPVILAEDRQQLPTTVALVIDQTASQTFGARLATAQAVRAELASRISDIEGIELRTLTVTDGVTDGTNLFAAVNEGLADVSPDRIGAIILVTDGQVHDAPAVARELGGAPVHALITGRDDEVDRRIQIDVSPRFGIVGEPQEVVYRVFDIGAAPDQEIAVSIYSGGELVAVESTGAGVSQTFRFVVPHGGEIVLELVAEPLEGELTTINNSAVVELDGIREALRVLLVSGEPHPGERTWRDLLKSDAAVDLIHFTILRPPEKLDITPQNELALIAFPTRELFSENLYDFDLIIFDRYQEQGALPQLYFDNIVSFVEDGGALLIAAGPDEMGPASIYNTGLWDVLPVSPTGNMVETPYHARVTEIGFRHPVTRDLPGSISDPPDWSRWFRLMEAEAPAGDVIMEGPGGLPLLVLGREGEGRVAMLLSDHAWLWARGFEGGGPHVALLRRVAHWLMQEPDLEEEALRVSANGAELTLERQTMADTVVPVLVRSPLGVESEVELAQIAGGLWRAKLPAEDVGLWRINDGERVAVTHVGPANPLEYLDPRSTEDRLAPIVESTDGYTGRVADVGGVPRIRMVAASGRYSGNDWLGIRHGAASTLLGVDRFPLFAGLLGLSILAGMLSLTWFREGR